MRIPKIVAVVPLLLSWGCATTPPSPRVGLDTTMGVGATAVMLEDALPLGRPVYVGDEDLFEKGLLGQSQRIGDVDVVTIDPRLDELTRVMVLIHEYAHFLVWESGGDSGHGDDWGREYARVFRVWTGAE